MLTPALNPALRPALRASGRAFAQITEFHPELTAFRRDLHAHPELGFEEVYTSGRVAQALKLCGVDEVHTSFVLRRVRITKLRPDILRFLEFPMQR